MRTGSNREPGALSSVVMMSDGSMPSSAAEAARDLVAAAEGQVRRADLDGERRDVRDEQPARRGRRSGRAAPAPRPRPCGLPRPGPRTPDRWRAAGSASRGRQEPERPGSSTSPNATKRSGPPIALGMGDQVGVVHQSTRSASRRRSAMATTSGPTRAASTVSYDGRGHHRSRAPRSESGAAVRAVVARSRSIE